MPVLNPDSAEGLSVPCELQIFAHSEEKADGPVGHTPLPPAQYDQPTAVSSGRPVQCDDPSAR